MSDETTKTERPSKVLAPPECFVLMPISEVDGYPSDHFRHVYNNIVRPACQTANVNPVRADEVSATNLIHLDIIKRLISAPIAICDLSTRNPNVLFELGIRQAFDKPVVLIQEQGTPAIFDISPLRYLEYSRDMRYHDVLETQRKLAESITETVHAHGDSTAVTSIVQLLALTDSARVPELKGDKGNVSFEFLRAELSQIRKTLETSTGVGRGLGRRDSIILVEYERLSSSLEKVSNYGSRLPTSVKLDHLSRLGDEIERFVQTAENRSEHALFRNLLSRAEGIHKQLTKDAEEIPF